MGHHVYNNLNLLIDYTGIIVAGDRLIDKFYIHMRYQRVWAYETVIEFVFEDGILIGTVDNSEFSETIRENIKKLWIKQIKNRQPTI